MLEITIKLSEAGFEVDVSDGTPLLFAVGALEVAKKLLMENNNSKQEPTSEIIDELK